MEVLFTSLVSRFTEWDLSKAVVSFNTALFTDGKQCNVFDFCSVIPDLAP